MTTKIDTSPARLRELAVELHSFEGGAQRDTIVSNLLDAVAAEKDAAASQKPVELPSQDEIESWRDVADDLLRGPAHTKTREAALKLQEAYLAVSELHYMGPLYLSPQPSEPAPVDVPLPEPVAYLVNALVCELDAVRPVQVYLLMEGSDPEFKAGYGGFWRGNDMLVTHEQCRAYAQAVLAAQKGTK